MKLYTYPGSPVCRPIAMFIADNGMKVEQQVVDLMAGEQYQPAFDRIRARPNWQTANAALYAWANFTKGQDYVRV